MTTYGNGASAAAIFLGEIVRAAIRAAATIARQAHAHHRRRRQAWVAYEALRRLDDRTLRDLGFDRSELTSIAAEFAGDAAHTRVRALEQTSTRKIFYG
jgi:uncharacterized protein YjiS (DUF1127 family)